MRHKENNLATVCVILKQKQRMSCEENVQGGKSLQNHGFFSLGNYWALNKLFYLVG